jgi:biotin carboxyl carrier protein
MTGRTRRFLIGAEELSVEILGDGRVRIPAHDLEVSVERLDDGTYVVDANGRRRMVVVAHAADHSWAMVDGEAFRVDTASLAHAPAAATSGHRATDDGLSAPMPATVTRVLVQPGQTVARGEIVVILEAMKMEMPLRAPRDGIVAHVRCEAGNLVQPGQPLVELQ